MGNIWKINKKSIVNILKIDNKYIGNQQEIYGK